MEKIEKDINEFILDNKSRIEKNLKTFKEGKGIRANKSDAGSTLYSRKVNNKLLFFRDNFSDVIIAKIDENLKFELYSDMMYFSNDAENASDNFKKDLFNLYFEDENTICLNRLESYLKENKETIQNNLETYRNETGYRVIMSAFLYLMRDGNDFVFEGSDGHEIGRIKNFLTDFELEINEYMYFRDKEYLIANAICSNKSQEPKKKLTLANLRDRAVCSVIEDMEIGESYKTNSPLDIVKTAENELSVYFSKGMLSCKLISYFDHFETIEGAFAVAWTAPAIGWAPHVLTDMAKKGGFELKNTNGNSEMSFPAVEIVSR